MAKPIKSQTSARRTRDLSNDDQSGLISLRTLAIVALVAILLMSWIRPVMSEEESPAESKKQPTRKLQIGIKKRVEDCQRKSRRGDLLHIHYRVRTLWFADVSLRPDLMRNTLF